MTQIQAQASQLRRAMGLAGERAARRACLCAIVLIAQLIATTHCQVSDGDEQFEFQHQDIGRISGLSSGAPQVAPQTTIVARQQAAPQQQPREAFAEAPTSPLPPAVAQVFERAPHQQTQHQSHHQHHGPGGHSRASQRGAQAGSQRKPARITLVPRRDPIQAPQQQQQPQVQPQAQAAQLIPAQLPSPPEQRQAQQQPQFQIAPSSGFEAAPTFAPPPQQVAPAAHHHQASSFQAAGPALSSFRATGGSVSARHSALIAQVAAERAAAGVSADQQLAPSATPQFGSAQQPAFASFASHSAPAGLAAQPTQAELSAPNPQQQQGQFAALAAPSQLAGQAATPTGFVNQPEEPVVAPSLEQVLGQGCPHKGVFSWENRDHCDRYYMCTNGTFTEEACPNGLAYSQQGAVYQHCAYNWNVQCGLKKTAEPIASPGCPWQFGIFPILQAGRCSIDYFVCEWGVPDTKRCSPEGLFYDDRIKGCQWADQLGCKSESLLNFKCPPEDEDNQFWPFPRYYHSTKDVIVCVNEQPRLVHCTEDQIVDPGSLACMEVNKKKKKF